MAFLQVLFGLVLQSSVVEGYVTDDETGAPLHGARVEIVAGQTFAVTDSSGRYALRADHAGWQHLRVVRLGYETQALQVVLPALGALRVDIALRAVPSRMPLVRISAPRFRTQRALEEGGTLVRRLSLRDVGTDPLLADADVLEGLAGDPDVSLAPDSPNALHIRGGSSDQVQYLVDGVPLYNATHSAGALSALNPDAIDAVALHIGARTAEFGGALSGTVDAQTQRPDSLRLRARGAISATAARVTIDGPLIPLRSEFTLSARRGAPSLFAGRPDRTRLTAAFADWLLKSTTRIARGDLTLLATAATDRTGFSARPEADGLAGAGRDRHHFDWGGATIAALWTAPVDSFTRLTARLWRAEFDGDAVWLGAEPLHMTSARQTHALHASLTRRRGLGELRFGGDIQHDRVAYHVLNAATRTEAADPSLTRGRESSVALFGEYSARLAARWDVRPGVRVALRANSVHIEPRFVAAFRLAPSLSIAGGLARTYQPVQSLRNPESPAAAVFGANIPVLANDRIPVGRSDEATLSMQATVGAHTRLAFDAYLRHLTGLVLAQPTDATPFTLGFPALGDGKAWGLGATAEARGDRTTARFTAGISKVRRQIRAHSGPMTAGYQPGFGTTQSITAAAGYRLGDHTVLRSALFARWGRRATLYDGALDWEGCDALDGGCEIAGTPGRSQGPISGVQLPPYLRWDLGVRRTWTRTVGGRAFEVAGHLTIRNLLDRRNVWAFGSPSADQPARALMLRPVSILTAGLDFHY